MANTDYIDKNDPALKAVESEKQTALKDSNKLYDDAVSANDKAVQSMIDQNNAAAKEAERFQQEQTDFTIDKIEQQKEQAKKDYTKEQSASYVDWQKQSAQYGANAEAMADRGMANTGYSESAQVSMYNTYQNRVATARASFDKITLEYNNGIKEAKLLNSSAIAKIKAEAMAAQLQLALEGLQYKNTMLTQKASAALAIDQTYNQKYMDVYDQLYKEATLKEQARQFDAQMKEEKRQFAILHPDEPVVSPGGTTINRTPSRNSGSGSNKSGPIKKPELIAQGQGAKVEVSTEYYIGKKNKDCKNGTFSNGYQPNNINGKKLSKTGDTVTFTTRTLSGKNVTVTQNVWKTSDGRRYYWDGTKNKYIETSSLKKTTTDAFNAYKKEAKKNQQRQAEVDARIGKSIKGALAKVDSIRKGWL